MKNLKKFASAILALSIVFTSLFVPSVNVSAAKADTKKYTVFENTYYPAAGNDSYMAVSGVNLRLSDGSLLNNIQLSGTEWRDKSGSEKNYSKYGFDSSQSDGFIVWYINRDDLSSTSPDETAKLNASTKLDSTYDFAYGSRFFNYTSWSSVNKSIDDIKDTGTLLTYVSFSDASYVNDAYVFMMDKNNNIVGIKLADEFYMADDAGTGKGISIPLSRFVNPDNDALILGEKLDTGYIKGAGILLHNPESNVKGWVANGDIYICNVERPENLTANMIAEGKATLAWEESLSDIKGYEIYRNEEKIGYIDASTLTYEDTTLENGNEYVYEVYACDRYGAKSIASNKASVYASSVGAPQNLTAESSFSDSLKVKLSWENPSYGTPSSYEIYRDGKKVGEADGSALEYVDDDELAENTYYNYYIKAYASDLSDASNTVTVYASTNGYPENVESDISGTDIVLRWKATNSAVKYNIYRNGTLYAAVDAPEASYTDAGWNYSEMYTYAVTSVDANNNESIMSAEVYAFKNENDKVASAIFEDMTADEFSLSKFNSSSFEISTDRASQGSKSLKVTFAPGSELQEGISFGANSAIDMSAMRVNGGRIEFAIFAPNEKAIENVKIGLECLTDKFDGTQHTARTGLKISDYIDYYGYWNYIKVPIADFSSTGIYSYGMSDSRYCGFKFGAVTGISLYDDVKHFNVDKTVYFDDVKLANFSAPGIAGVSLADGTEITSGSTVSASTKQLNVKFDTGIDETTLDGNVILCSTSGEGAVSLPVECAYDSANKTVQVKFSASLEKSMNYSLKFAGVKSDKGSEIASAAFDFVTNNDDTDAYTTMADEEKIIVPSSNVKKDSSVTLRLSLDSENAKKAVVDGIDININYTSDVINNPSIKLAASLSTAKVSITEGVINISIPKESGKYVIGSYIADITFSASGLGSSSVTVDGTLHQAEPAKDVKVSNKDAATILVTNPTIGGGGGGGSSTSSGGRSDRKTTGGSITVNPSDPNSSNIISNDKFSDSGRVEWAKTAIEYLGKNGIINGYEDGTFRPETEVTRAEFITMIIRAFADIDENASTEFSDVSADSWYYSALATAEKYGIATGYDGKFGGDETISRQDMCTMLARAAEALKLSITGTYGGIIFDDENEIADYAKESIEKLQRAGIVNGIGANMFDPNGRVTRAMAAKVIYELNRIK